MGVISSNFIGQISFVIFFMTQPTKLLDLTRSHKERFFINEDGQRSPIRTKLRYESLHRFSGTGKKGEEGFDCEVNRTCT